jgi:hypothetical protein
VAREAVFAVEDHGGLVVALRGARDAGGERVLGVVEGAAFEPDGVRHLAREHVARLVVPADTEEVRDRRPEVRPALDGELPERAVVVHLDAALGAQPPAEGFDLGVGNVARLGAPEDFGSVGGVRHAPSLILRIGKSLWSEPPRNPSFEWGSPTPTAGGRRTS